MGTRLWAITPALDRNIAEEQKREEAKLLQEAEGELAELRAYELIDEGKASFAGEYGSN